MFTLRPATHLQSERIETNLNGCQTLAALPAARLQRTSKGGGDWGWFFAVGADSAELFFC
jgi:hypothetical protein